MRLVPTSRPTAPTSSTSGTVSFIVDTLSAIVPPVYGIQEKKRISATSFREGRERECQTSDLAQFPFRWGDTLKFSAANRRVGHTWYLLCRSTRHCYPKYGRDRLPPW